MRFLRTGLIAVAVLWALSAHAQWQVPNNSIPIGKGQGVVGFGSTNPSSTGVRCLLDTTPPTFGICGSGSIYNIMSSPYNAACDGVTNDTAAINSAIDAANAAGGGTVTAPDGKICIIGTGTSVVLKDNVTINGKFTLKGNSATNNTEMIVAIGKTNVGLQNITIDMIDSFVNGNNNNVAFSSLNSSVLVQGINITNKGNMGIALNGTGTSRILNNTITMNSPYGSGHQNQAILISSSGGVASSVIVDGNVMVGSGINAITQNLQITKNKISAMRYGGGIGVSSVTASGARCDFNPCLGNIIALNEISAGVGIDDIGTIIVGIEIFDRRGIVIGNRVWNMAGEAIHGGAASITGNVAYDNCMYYTTNASVGTPCNAFNTRKDIDDGSDTIWSANKAFNSFGATLAVTGTQNVAGVIRIIVASTATVGLGSFNDIVPCQVRNVGGTTNANNGWAQCKVIDATHIELTGSVFNSAWTAGGTIGGLQDYSYADTSAALTNVQLTGNSFGPGFLGTVNLLSTSTGNVAYGRQSITSANSNALTVGPNGQTNPTLQVDTSAVNAATGIRIKSQAAAGTVGIAALSSAADESLTIDAKGAGTIQLGQVSTGPIGLNRGTAITGNSTLAGTWTQTSQNAAALTVGRQGATSPALQVDSNAASSATGWKITANAAAAGTNLAVISSGTNEPGSINSKGSGSLTLQDVGTGNIVLNRATNVANGNLTENSVRVITGSLGSTDNAVLRADGTGTNVAQGSAMTIADTTGEPTYPGASFTAYTPTVTATTNSFTSVSATGFYREQGKQVSYRVVIVITTNGTAAGRLRFTVPSGTIAAIGAGTATGFTNTAIPVIGSPFFDNNDRISVVKYDGTFPGADGVTIYIAGWYEKS